MLFVFGYLVPGNDWPVTLIRVTEAVFVAATITCFFFAGTVRHDRPEFRGLLVTIGSISAGIGVVMPFELAPFFFDVRGEVMIASVMLILLYPFTILGFCLLFLLLTRSSV